MVVLLLGFVWAFLKLFTHLVKIVLRIAAPFLAICIELLLSLLALVYSPILFVSAGLCLPLRVEQPRDRFNLRSMILVTAIVLTGLVKVLFPRLSILVPFLVLLLWSLLLSAIFYLIRTKKWHITATASGAIGFLLGVLLGLPILTEASSLLHLGLITRGLAMGMREGEAVQGKS
jgi:hypothetical protein